MQLRTWKKLLIWQQGNRKFIATWKKQVVLIQLAALVQMRKGKHQAALKTIYHAQQIVAHLDETA